MITMSEDKLQAGVRFFKERMYQCSIEDAIRQLQAFWQDTEDHEGRKWQPIETAPKDGTFLVCAVGDSRGPFVVSGTILWRAREAGTPGHLSLHHLTHWMPLPAPHNNATVEDLRQLPPEQRPSAQMRESHRLDDKIKALPPARPMGS
jgi:hypothetical protein